LACEGCSEVQGDDVQRVSLCDRCVLIVFAHFTSVDAARSLTDMLCAEVQKICILVCTGAQYLIGH
jgi:hypothetical protein